MSDVDEELERRFLAAYDENGVDRTLVRRSLSMTPTERLLGLESFLDTLATARRVDASELAPVSDAPASTNS